MSYQISVIYRAQSFSKCESQFLPSSLGLQKKVGKVSFYRAHSVSKRKSVKSVSTKLTRLPKEKWRSRFSPSALGHQRKVGEVSFHRAHSVLSRNSVLTEFTRRLKDFTEFSVLIELSQLTQELIFEQSLPC